MSDPSKQGERQRRREDVERELRERATERERQGRGSTPDERLMERALEIEPGVEQHAGEDPGGVPAPERDDERT